VINLTTARAVDIVGRPSEQVEEVRSIGRTPGFDPIWFGVLSMMMVAMGLVFPPVGLIAFIVSATAGVDLMKVYKGTSILMLSIVATTALLMIFPQIALWLPATMR